MTLPNTLTGVRFIIAPVLALLAWGNHPLLYVLCLFLAFLSDLMDGACARLLSLRSELGATLDTLGDCVIYAILPITAWWLWPELVQRELPFVGLVVFSYTVPAIVGAMKFKVVTSYHTLGAKLAAAAVGSSVMLMFLGGPTLPFRCAAFISTAAALEQIGITFVLPNLRSDVVSLWHVLRQIRFPDHPDM